VIEELLHAASLWGAGLSTILALFQIKNLVRDKPVIKTDATLAFRSVSDSEPEYGTRQITPQGTTEIVVSFEISNHGRRSIQIVAVFIEGRQGQLNQVESRNLPVVVEPGCQITTIIQKEWLDDPEMIRVGVFDALGKRHALRSSIASELFADCRSLPSNRRLLTEPPLWVWQVRDKATLSLKTQK
jgi:hypothetical protein